jgi:DNA ligase-1
LRGDVGEVALYARSGALESAVLALFHPIGFMLAQPLATAEEIATTLSTPFAVEDKYDGIRAQAHVSADRVALYSRTLDEITPGYPEVVAALRRLVVDDDSPSLPDEAGFGNGLRNAPGTLDALGGPGVPPQHQNASSAANEPNRFPAVGSGGFQDTDARASGPTRHVARHPVTLILDGELLAVDPADPHRPLPFKSLQRRLGRKAPTEAVLAEVPVAFVAYDVLAADGALVVDEPYSVRREHLAALSWPAHAAMLAPMRTVDSAEGVDQAFDTARAAGNEGIIAKDLASPYAPGRRGKAWIKLKRAMATLDVVVTGAERGHGKRRSVLSDYTFAVRASEADDTLLNVGKAYNGLTDAEIAELTVASRRSPFSASDGITKSSPRWCSK